MVLVSVNCLLPQHGVGGTLWFSTFRQGMASPDSICEPNITNIESDKPESFPKKNITVRTCDFCALCDCCDILYYSRPKSNEKRQVQRKDLLMFH